jgi:DNA adenine methylase
MKPLIKYRGGKSNEIPNIEMHIPKYKGRYIEPFFGGGALYFHLEPKQAIINDINSKLIAFYKGVKNKYLMLRAELDEVEKIYEANRRQFDSLKRQTPNERVEDKNEELYYKIRDMFNDLTYKNIPMPCFISSSIKLPILA